MTFRTFTLRYFRNRGYFWVYLEHFGGSVVLKAEEVPDAFHRESGALGIFGCFSAARVMMTQDNAKRIIGTDVNENHVVYHVT